MPQKPHILIIDETSETLCFIRELLSAESGVIIEAHSGKEAVSLAKKHNFALILLDSNMSDMSSCEITNSIYKNSDERPPIIFITPDHLDEESVVKLYENGAVDYIKKPINENILRGKVKIFIDLFVQKETLRKLYKDAEKANVIKSEFLSNMSHEIRTPLNAVIGMTELLLDKDNSDVQYRKLKTILYSGETLLQLINDMLDLSKIESNKMELEEVPFDLLTLAEDVSDVLAIKSYEKRVEFILKYDQNTPRNVIGDQIRTKQILYNLAVNAIKFTEKGYISITISSKKSSDKNHLFTITVKDTGIGVAKDKQEYIFNKFTQADGSTTRKFGGTGLGLTICKQLCEMMGGNIKLNSFPGKGSSFIASIDLELDKNALNAQKEKPQLDGLRVLVLDGSKAVSQYLELILKSFGVEVTLVENARQAIAQLNDAAAKKQPFHVALIDFMIADIEAIDFPKLTKKAKNLGDLILIMMSASSKKNLETELEEEGFSGYLTKPIREDLLSKLLHIVWTERNNGSDKKQITQQIISSKELYEKQNRSFVAFNDAKILLVEDSIVNREIAAHMLGDLGCHITQAENGQEAVDLVKNHRFDLIFMDCQMPIMDGFEAIAIIKKMMSKGEILMTPVIAFTANAMKGDREKCLNAGMNDYISKPVHQRELKKMLAKWLA